MLTAADLAWMRQINEANLPDSCEIHRLTRTSDNAGGYTEAWAPVDGGPFDCRVSAVGQGGQERVIADRMQLVSPWVVTLAWDQDVRADDRLFVTNAETEVVTEYEVKAPIAGKSYQASLPVVCERYG